MTLYVAKPRELVELVVLGLLCEVPRHPYDIQREVKQRGNTSFVRGMPRSIYHAVDTLLEQGYIRAGDVSREGGRPERTTYAATERGKEAFVVRLTHLLATPTDQATYHAALSLVMALTRDQFIAALELRLAAIDVEIEAGQERVTQVREWLPRLVLIEVEYLQSQLRAERDWTEAIIADARDGRLSWDLKFRKPPPR